MNSIPFLASIRNTPEYLETCRFPLAARYLQFLDLLVSSPGTHGVFDRALDGGLVLMHNAAATNLEVAINFAGVPLFLFSDRAFSFEKRVLIISAIVAQKIAHRALYAPNAA